MKPNTYIVVLCDDLYLDLLKSKCTKVGTPRSIKDIYIVESILDIEEIRSIYGVISVEYDEDDEPDDSGINAIHEAFVQENPKNWFLPALSNTENRYEYPADGSGVDIYIIDSGIYYHNNEFENRVENLWSFDNKAFGEDVNKHYHGTMAAGCAAGKKYGVAKGATLINLRTNWKNSTTLKAMDMVLYHHLNKSDDRGSVLSMSFSSTASWAYKHAISKLIDNGIVCFASTGNYQEPEARFPAGNDIVLGVSCLAQGDKPGEMKPAVYSNYGEGTDIWAPGHNGIVAEYGSVDGVMPASGTSAACPVAAGVMAIFLTGSKKLVNGNEVSQCIREFMLKSTKQIFLKDEYDRKYSTYDSRVVSTQFDFSIFKMGPAVEPEPPILEPEPEPPVTTPPKEIDPKPKKKDNSKKKLIIGGIIVVSLILGVLLF